MFNRYKMYTILGHLQLNIKLFTGIHQWAFVNLLESGHHNMAYMF